MIRIGFILLMALLWPAELMAQAYEQAVELCRAHKRVVSDTVWSNPISAAHYGDIDVSYYGLDVHAETQDTYLQGFVEIRGRATTDMLDSLFLDMHHQLQVDSVCMYEQPIAFAHGHDNVLRLFGFAPLPLLQPFVLRVYYHGMGYHNAKGRGYNSKNRAGVGRINWTLSEPFYTHYWMPCKQDLKDKADSISVAVLTSLPNKVGSNGKLMTVDSLPNNKIRYVWKSSYPIDYYLISIAIAPYMVYEIFTAPTAGKTLPILNYLYPDSLRFVQEKRAIDCTAMQMNLLRERFGEYPFIDEKYGHCIAPLSGGMEHQTMTTMSGFSFHLAVHEMAHQWFGNHVTCASWGDIWLNEGFATYAQYLALEHFADAQLAHSFMRAVQARAMRQPDGSVYVPPPFWNDRDRIFNGRLSYYKAAAVIHLIRFVLNDDELFFECLRQYQQTHAFRVASTLDFQRVLEAHSPHDWEQFFQQWVYGEGFPHYEIQWQQSHEHQLQLYVQQQPSTPRAAFFRMPWQLRVFFCDGRDTVLRLQQKQPHMQWQIGVRGRVEAIEANPYANALMLMTHQPMRIMQSAIPYPNPVQHKCYLEFKNAMPGRCYELYNASMQCVQAGKADNYILEIDTAPLAAGRYVLRIVGATTEAQHILIKM